MESRGPVSIATTPSRVSTPAAAERRPTGLDTEVPNVHRSGDRAVVIGAGFGGIASALRLAALGKRVTLVDRLDQLGGRGRVFARDGYTFDAGPTVITAPFLFEELFALFNKSLHEHVTLVPCDPWYRVQFHDGDTFDYTGDIDRTLEQIERIEPRDVRGYRRMLKACDEIYRIGFERLGDVPFDKPGAMARAVPQMMRLGSFRSTYAFVAKHLRSEKLRRVFTFQPLLVGGNPFKTSSIYALIQTVERRFGVHYAMGGTGALVRALGDLLEHAGVDVQLGQTVASVETRDRETVGVQLESGRFIPAGLVVANADPSFVYQHMLPTDRGPRLQRFRSKHMKYSMGLFVLYFGSRKQYPGLAHHTILLSERYRELLKDIFDRKLLPADPSLYVHAPTRTDPGIAPAGRECFYVLAPVPNLQGGIDWENEGDAFRDAIIERIDREMAPGLSEHVEADFYVTPRYFKETLLSTHGAGFGVQPILSQSAYFRFHARCPHYRNLYFVGAGTHPGAGLPGVLSTAKAMERAVIRDGFAREVAAS